MIETKITNEQKIKVSLTPVTDTGKPAKLDGNPQWDVIDGASTLDVADDGMSAFIVSSDTPGVTNILVKADADLGEGVEEIAANIIVTVVGANAKNLGLTLGDPVAK